MMKTVNFKNRKKIVVYKMEPKKKIFIIVLISVFLVFAMMSRLSNFVSYNLRDYLKEKVNKENLLLLKSSFSYLRSEEVDLNNLINVVKNSKEEIVEVGFNIKECTNILASITSNLNNSMTEFNYLGYKLDIPIGFISSNVLFRNLGPKIPIKVEVGDVALGNISTVVKEFGINSALIEIHVTVSITTSILYPFDTLNNTTSYDTLISSKIISGVVPDFYNGMINSKSDTISLPLNE